MVPWSGVALYLLTSTLQDQLKVILNERTDDKKSILSMKCEGVFELDKLFISPSVCSILFISHSSLKQNIYSTFLKFVFPVYKIGCQTRLGIDVKPKENSEARLNKFKQI